MQIAQEYVARDSFGCRTEPYALESSGAFGACKIPASAARVVGEEGGLNSSMSNGRFDGDRGRVVELMCELTRLEMEGERRDELGRGKWPVAGCGMH